MQTITITVSGKVQGVYYRQSTKEMATTLGITGYVKNLVDGNVYIVATGTKEQLDKLIAWCRQGPSKARVTGVEVQESPLLEFDGFSIQRF
jgi:acylphosphatase